MPAESFTARYWVWKKVLMGMLRVCVCVCVCVCGVCVRACVREALPM